MMSELRRNTVFRTSCLAVAVAAFATVLSTPASAKPTSPGERDASGLLVVGASPVDPVPAKAARAYGLALRLSEENPLDFGHPYLKGGTVTLPTTDSSTAALARSAPEAVPAALLAYRKQTARRSATSAEAEKGAVPAEKRLRLTTKDARAFGAGVRPVAGTQSRMQVERTKNAVFDLGLEPRFKSARVWQSEVDVLSGSVILSVERLTPQLGLAIVKAFGTEAVKVRLAKAPDTRPGSRAADTSPFYGGAAINTPVGGCTSGFSWYSGATHMMVDAGHCVRNGGSVSTPATGMGTVAQSSRENWNAGTGTVYLTGQSTYRGDISLITMSADKGSSGRIYRGSATSASSFRVASMWSRRAQAGDQYCTGGSRAGEVCGWTVGNAGVNHAYSSGEVVRGAVVSRSKTGWCTRPGDSGGPIYTVAADGSVAAKGIHSGGGGGGSDYYGGLFDQCFEVFTDIYDPYFAFPGYVRTS